MKVPVRRRGLGLGESLDPPHGAQLSPDQREWHEASRQLLGPYTVTAYHPGTVCFHRPTSSKPLGYQCQLSLMLDGRRIILGCVILSRMSQTQSSWEIP